ncbi:aspartate/glutamate racemase family protein [Hoeflea sp.]|uniref:aspartate/glutamate racemase family protein n=1 Tax=Hoeflea sp. TaxID=1940281 RepID=UPI003A956999
MIRLWHQSVNELDQVENYRRALSEHAAKVLPDSVSVEVRGLSTGTYAGLSPSEALGNAVTYHRCLSQVIDLAIEAEKTGFDAFVMGSFSEPFLREMRTAVDIPVISMTEAALLTACSLGTYSGLIANYPNVQWMVKSSVDKHRLNARVLEVACLEPPVDEFEMSAAYDDPTGLVGNFRAAAKRLVAAGADVIIPAEGVMARLITGTGLNRVDGAPVLDVFAIAWAHAMTMVELQRSTGLSVGRAWTYRR